MSARKIIWDIPGEGDITISADGDGTLTSHDADGVQRAVGGGGVQTVSLLGPFTVAFDTPVGLNTFGDPGGAYLEVFALPDGCAVIAAWAEATVGWDGPGATYRQIAFAIMPQGDDGSFSSDISASNDVYAPDTTAPGVFGLAGVVNSVTPIQVARAISGAALAASYNSDVAAVSGEAAIYALIATPS